MIDSEAITYNNLLRAILCVILKYAMLHSEKERSGVTICIRVSYAFCGIEHCVRARYRGIPGWSITTEVKRQSHTAEL